MHEWDLQRGGVRIFVECSRVDSDAASIVHVHGPTGLPAFDLPSLLTWSPRVTCACDATTSNGVIKRSGIWR